MSLSSTRSKSIIPVYGAQNLAPTEPLLRLREEKKSSHYLCDFLKRRFDGYLQKDRTVRNEILSVGQLISLFIEGKQLVAPNPFTGGYEVIQPSREDESTRRAMNLMQFYATNWITKFVLSNPNIIIRAGKDTEKSVGAAKAADIIGDHYENKFYRPWFNQQEALLCLTFGTYIERIRHDAGIKGIIGLREIVENREVRIGDGAGYCGECEAVAPAANFAKSVDAPDGSQGQTQACPRCGSEAVLVEPAASGMVPSVVDREEVEMGDLICEQLPLPGCWWDLKYRAEDSPHFIYRQRIPFGRVRQLLGNVNLPGGNHGDADIGLDIIDMLAKSGQALAGYSSHGAHRRNGSIWEDTVNLDEMWMLPEEYAGETAQGDEETVSGVPIPAGTKYTEIFPEGMCAVGINGMSVVLGLYGEKHKNQIVSGVYHMKALSGAGRGGADWIEPQKRINKFDSQAINYMDGVSTPACIYDAELISEEEVGYMGQPRANIAVDLSRLPQTKGLNDAVKFVTPGSLPGQFVQYTQEFLGHMMQLSSHITDFSGGLPGVNNKTATGAQIASANSNSLFAPVLQIKAEVRMRAVEMTIEEYRKRFPLKRYFTLGGEYGAAQGIWLAAADIDADLALDWEKDSEAPKNNFTKREDLESFFMMVGGAQGYIALREADPELAAELGRSWNIRVKGQDYDVVGQRCRTRVDQMMQGLQMGVQDPMQLVSMIQPPPSAMEPSHQAKARWWSEWLDTDDALDPQHLPLRAAAELMIELHYSFNGMIAGAMQQQAQAVAGPPPPGPAQKSQPPPQARKAA